MICVVTSDDFWDYTDGQQVEGRTCCDSPILRLIEKFMGEIPRRLNNMAEIIKISKNFLIYIVSRRWLQVIFPKVT